MMYIWLVSFESFVHMRGYVVEGAGSREVESREVWGNQ